MCTRCGTFACNACYALQTDAGPTCVACAHVVVAELVPWETPEKYGRIRAFWLTTKRVSFEPTRFFRAVALRPEWKAPFSYGVIVLFIAAVLQTSIQQATRVLVPRIVLVPTELAPMFASDFSWFSMALDLVSIPFSLLVSAGVAHLTLRVCGFSRAPFSMTLRAICYAYAPGLWLMPIPLVGQGFASIWLIVAQIIGLREVHGITTWRATIAVLAPIVIVVFFLGLFMTALLLANSPAISG